MNGRIYAFDPAGRADVTGDPFVATLAVGDNPGTPGTTRRWMTWPSTARDKWLRAGAVAGQFGFYSDDAAKSFFAASIAAPPNDPLDPLQMVDHVVAGA